MPVIRCGLHSLPHGHLTSVLPAGRHDRVGHMEKAIRAIWFVRENDLVRDIILPHHDVAIPARC